VNDTFDSSPTCRAAAPPGIPERIGGLWRLAGNLWWSWRPDARALFRSLDLSLWRSTRHNPVAMLRRMEPEALEALAEDPAFLREYEAVLTAFDALSASGASWFAGRYGELEDSVIAYFCAEFGVHSSIPVYSGGLGLLAGDHLKESSDLGVPLVGCGLLYQKGYFRQRISPEGEQIAVDEPLVPELTPLEPVPGVDEGLVVARVELAGRTVGIRVWRLHVGRARIYLLDTDFEANAPEDRQLSHQLYGGDAETRLRQEIVLGIGGVRVLRALGCSPAAWHANEGHAAFLALERMRVLVGGGATPERSIARVAETTLFTTHTPVVAGHDAFPTELIDKYFAGYWPQLGLDRERFHALGRLPADDGRFHMPALALRCCQYRNGVSERHGQVARRMWHGMWPETEEGPDEEEARNPIDHITNGVHLPTWLAPEFRRLFDRCLTPEWEVRQDDAALWEGAVDLPDEEVWAAHLACKRRLFRLIRERARVAWSGGGAPAAQVVASGTLLDPDALTIGFARRFATYKRATLLLTDVGRLLRLLLDARRPVQFIFAGKAHPADGPGQALLAEVYRAAADPRFGGRIAFVEDYEMHLAHALVAGVDVWLNTPLPPMEASGTSGQKASINGVPQLSTADGWWAEGRTGRNGWTIGAAVPAAELGDTGSPGGDRDAADAASFYELLEREVQPLFYSRDPDGIPRAWIRTMKHTIRTAGGRFSARRMLKEYVERYYVPAARAASASVPERATR